MKIENNLMVSVEYELRELNAGGKVIETIEGSKPLRFIYGKGRMLPSFESNLISLDKGDRFEFSISPDQAYGEKREEMIIKVPKNVFEKDGKLDENICMIGNEVPMIDSNGNPLNGIINEISDNWVRMDFNHPMAGIDLFFSGKIIDVREPSEEKLTGNASSCAGCQSGDHSSCSGSC